LEVGLESLQTAVDYVLANARSSEDFAGSVSVNLLMLAGTVFGGWQMGLAALAVSNDSEISDSFKQNKLATSRFYMKHVLPRASSFASTVQVGGESVMTIPVEQL